MGFLLRAFILVDQEKTAFENKLFFKVLNFPFKIFEFMKDKRHLEEMNYLEFHLLQLD